MLVFRNIWRALFSCNTRFEIHPFALLLTILKFAFLIQNKRRANLMI